MTRTVATDLATARARRWWQTRRPVRSIRRAAAFIDDVGFALLFPARGLQLPCLFNASSERQAESMATVEWDPDGARVWGWKDRLPLEGLAWSGPFLQGRASLLSLGLVSHLYPRSGRPEDFTESDLSADAQRIAEMILLSGPTPTVLLREALDMEGKGGRPRFAKAVTELGRVLVVTNYGTQDLGGSWPSAVLELVARAFPGLGPGNDERAARTFMRTMMQAEPRDLARAFGWPLTRARASLAAVASSR